MNVTVSAKISVVTKPEPTLSKDGKSTFYKIGIISGSEVGMLNCSEDVFNKVEPGKEFEVLGHYSTDYKSLRLVNAFPVK
ncbi:MAG: hypothetical protein FWE14_00035 [Lachnospiraceae bacterium]|nr:hypothetical protein [Lachnospiraceae bacterium]